MPWGSAIQPASAGSKHGKYTSLINVVAGCLVKVFMYLTIKTNHIKIRVWRNPIIFLALSHGTITALRQGAFIHFYAFIKPINLLIMVLFLPPVGLKCIHNCIVTEINIQLNPLCPKSLCIQCDMGVRIPGHLNGSAYCHSQWALSDRKQDEWANDEAAALSLCSAVRHKQTVHRGLFFSPQILLQSGLVLNICNYLGLCRWD